MNNVILFGVFFIIVIINMSRMIQQSLEDNNNIYACKSVNNTLSIAITLYFYYINIDSITLRIENILNEVKFVGTISLIVVKLIIVIISLYFLKKVIQGILNLLVLSFVKEKQEKKISIYTNNVIYSIIKSTAIISIVFVLIMFYEMIGIGPNNLEKFKDNIVYNMLEDNLPKYSKNILREIDNNNEFSISTSSYITTYYNGVTLEEGVKSNKDIDRKARELTKNAKNDFEKARSIYVWIGNTINYDYKKAEKALENSEELDSGAIVAFNDKSGICFDYACLYIAMAREVGLKVRLVTGNGFDGIQYGPHAWNEVYISEDDEWISIDSTFYMAGDYFNNKDFNSDHIKESIIGEW